MTQQTTKPVLVEYDAKRPLLRVFFGLLEAIAFVWYQHGYTAKLPPPLPCNGGWTEGLEFLSYFGALAIFIEVIHWIAWRILHRKEILSFEEEQQLFGKTTRLGVRNRGLQARGVQELFGPSPEIAEGTPPGSAGPKDYVLVESGGRLPLVPRNPLLAFVFSLGLLVLVLLFHSPGSVDSCAPSTFSWPDLFGRLVVAYAFLALGSIAEFRIVGENRHSPPANLA
jgi:hypothetical protein